jgi:hypothetical protein
MWFGKFRVGGPTGLFVFVFVEVEYMRCIS